MSITNKDRLLPNEERGPHMNHGLTKRERFAMAAMQGILALMSNPTTEITAKTPEEFDKGIATQALRIADALLEELDK